MAFRIYVFPAARLPWTLKINPLWWFGNIDDPEPPVWYWANWPLWRRRMGWAFRNPLHNFTNYVIGVRDRTRTVRGTPPVSVILNSDVGSTGWRWKLTSIPPFIHLPFVSYSSSGWDFYLGWRFTGDFGITCRRRAL